MHITVIRLLSDKLKEHKTLSQPQYQQLSVFIHTCLDMLFTVCFFVIVCVCVCTDMNFSAEDKVSGIRFCTAVHQHPR